jgi:hypothetical protein
MNQDQVIVAHQDVNRKISVDDIDLDVLDNDELQDLTNEIQVILRLRVLIGERKDAMILKLHKTIDKIKAKMLKEAKAEIEEEKKNLKKESEEEEESSCEEVIYNKKTPKGKVTRKVAPKKK